MLGKQYCPECGAEIGFDIKIPEKSYLIDYDKGFSRNDNNDAWSPNGDGLYFEFYCTEDMMHELNDSISEEWKDEVIKNFKDWIKK
jgi:hypothetical protein